MQQLPALLMSLRQAWMVRRLYLKLKTPLK